MQVKEIWREGDIKEPDIERDDAHSYIFCQLMTENKVDKKDTVEKKKKRKKRSKESRDIDTEGKMESEQCQRIPS